MSSGDSGEYVQCRLTLTLGSTGTSSTVDVVEIRDLDGPNLFRLEPAIKIGLRFDDGEPRDTATQRIEERIAAAHRLTGQQPPQVLVHKVDHSDELAVTFDWHWRRFALTTARLACKPQYVLDDESVTETLHERLEDDRDNGRTPEWVRDEDRKTRSVGVTGTNGKTTTTRMLAHIAQVAGKGVGWSSSTGVYINGEQVLEGDYSGPSGARRVLEDPDVEFGMLETARGGLLLRGLAYESNDVSVFLNVSADHLSLQGIETIETLAEVKSVVVRVTRPDGLVVLSADDPLVLAYRDRVKAPVMLISQNPDSNAIQDHLNSGREVIVSDGNSIELRSAEGSVSIARVADIPITFGGAAPFMIENSMAAAAAALGLGFTLDEIRDGLTTFRSDSSSNKGRLNVFEVAGRRAVVDYAHNDTGLIGLSSFSKRICSPGGAFHLVIGTAGDRRDEDLVALGKIANREADFVYLKDTPGYLRGRDPGDMPELMRQGFKSGDGDARLMGDYEDECAAFVAALEESNRGDLIAVMCQVDQDRIINEIKAEGRPRSNRIRLTGPRPFAYHLVIRPECDRARACKV